VITRLARTGLLCAAAAALSCNWGTFDDLKGDTWVVLLDRDDTDATGDLGIDITAIPLASGTNGVKFAISAGDVSGLAEATIDASGDVTSFPGFDGDGSGAGQIRPISRTMSTAYALVPYTGTNYLAGIPDKDIVAEYQAGPEGVRTLITSTVDRTGEALAVGNLGLGSTNPDVVAVGFTGITILPGGTSTNAVSCQIQAPAKNITQPLVPLENVKVARMDAGTGPQHIVVSGKDGQGTARIYILEAAQVRDNSGGNCPTATSITVDGGVAPGSIAIADLDKNGANDIIAGLLGTSGGGLGRVLVYLNPTHGGAAPAPMEIPAMTADRSSSLRGSRIRVANIDNESNEEIIVGDGSAPVVDGKGGQVQIYRWGAGGAGCEARGPACLVRTLFDAGGKDYFGRALAIGQFRSGSSTKNVLAVAQKDQVVVYFRIATTDTDPRQ
jgi:hypothetical protein